MSPACLSRLGVEIYLNIRVAQNELLPNRLFTPAIQRKQEASFHKALWEINEMSWPPYLCCYHFVCVRVHVIDVITLKLDKSAQLLFTRVVCWPQSGSPRGFYSIQYCNNTSGETYCFHRSLILVFTLTINYVLTTSCFVQRISFK